MEYGASGSSSGLLSRVFTALRILNNETNPAVLTALRSFVLRRTNLWWLLSMSRKSLQVIGAAYHALRPG